MEAADKAARFMQLCNAHGLPLVALTDTPGFMVGPEIEAQAQVRHVCRMFVSWPTGEFGAMGLEGAVKLGFRKELEDATPGAEREALYQKLVAQQYENGQAMNMAATHKEPPGARYVDTW